MLLTLAAIFFQLLALSPQRGSVLAQRVNSQVEGDESQTQLRNQLQHLVEDISTIVTYFEMDNSSVIVELARQVAELRRDMAGLNNNMTRMRQEMQNLTEKCERHSLGMH